MNAMRPMKVKPTKAQVIKILSRYHEADLDGYMRMLPALEQGGLLSRQQADVVLRAIQDLLAERSRGVCSLCGRTK